MYYEMLTMIKIHRGEIEGGFEMFEGLYQYAQKLGHQDIRFANFLANMAEFFYVSKPERCIDIFKESRVDFKINLIKRGLKNVDIHESIDVKNGSVKEQKIPKIVKEKEKVPVEENKKDPKAKGKVDPKNEPQVEKDYSDIEKVVTFEREMNHELFAIDNAEGQKINKNNNIYLLDLDNYIKVSIRFAHACCTIESRYELSITVIQDTLSLMNRCVYLNPYHKYMAHYLYGYCSKMIFLGKIKDFQKQYSVSSSAKGPSKYHEFIEGIPNSGLAPGHLFQQLPNFSNHIRNSWKELLNTAKEHLTKCLAIAKSEWVFGEFGIDLSDGAYNLAEVCFLLSEYRESIQKYKHIDQKAIYLQRGGVNPQQPNDEPENLEEMFDKWQSEQLDHEKLEVLNLNKKAKEYFELGNKLFNARNELEEKYHAIIQTNLTDPSKIPKEFMNDIFESQAIQSSSFLETVSETMEPDLWAKLKAKIMMKVDAGEVISTFKSTINELLYFTFGIERKCKGISLLHRYLRLNLASYVQRCVVDYPEVKDITELTEENEKEYDNTKDKQWMKFTDKHSDFFYLLQESQNLLAPEIVAEDEN